jgi:serine/threonine protein kinase
MRFDLQDHMRARYELLGLLGEGGMGVVYKARDTQLDRVVALKFLTAGGSPSTPARERALDEARAIAALNHPNIATIYEIGDSALAPVLVLEYLPGGTLRARTGARPLTLAEIIDCGLQIADGLAHAHEHGVIHGDIKTENLMFSHDGRLKITDFGSARLYDDRTVHIDNGIAGTLMYMAPECLQGVGADVVTDVFSLGVVLEEIARPHVMPDAFQQIVARATARDRTQRFQSVKDFAAALRRVTIAEPTRPRDTITVLVIEDDETLRDTLEISLEGEGYRVIKAGNGREGIRAAETGRPDLVLLDVTLPGMNGFDVCRELRSHGLAAPIIMVTGRADEVDRVVGLEIGADDYLTKPFGRRELLARIRVHLRRTAAAALRV